MSPGILLENITWMEAEKLLNDDRVVVLPIGAAAKEHGPHLPLNNDFLIAEFLKTAVLEKTDSIIAPTINYSYYPAFVEYPGSTSLSEQTATNMIAEICLGLSKFGARKFYALNTGFSTIRCLRSAQTRLEKENLILRYTDLPQLLKQYESMFEQEGGSHADEMETSIMLYITPDKVDMTKAVKDFDAKGKGALTRKPDGRGTYSPTGIFGDPTLATQEKGKTIVESLVTAIVQEVKELRRLQPA